MANAGPGWIDSAITAVATVSAGIIGAGRFASEVSGTSADALDVQESRIQAAGAIIMLRNINNDDLYEVEITAAGMVTRFRRVASEEE